MTEFSELMNGCRTRRRRLERCRQRRLAAGPHRLWRTWPPRSAWKPRMRRFPDLPPLRSAQFVFIGPATGRLRIKPTELRRGKSTVFVGVDLHGDDGLATRAMLCFGAARPSSVALDTAGRRATPKPPDSLPDVLRRAHRRSCISCSISTASPPAANLPFSGAAEPDMMLWLRHRDPVLKPSLVSLLALADAPPPGVLAMVRESGRDQHHDVVDRHADGYHRDRRRLVAGRTSRPTARPMAIPVRP